MGVENEGMGMGGGGMFPPHNFRWGERVYSISPGFSACFMYGGVRIVRAWPKFAISKNQKDFENLISPMERVT